MNTLACGSRRPGTLRSTAILAFLFSSVAALQTDYTPLFGAWVRLNDNRPILSPRGTGFEARGVVTPAVVRHGDRFVMLSSVSGTATYPSDAVGVDVAPSRV